MRCKTFLGAISLLSSSVCLSAAPALAQDQLSAAFGDVIGGNAADSFVVVAGAGGSVDEFGLATIDNVLSSDIPCVHVGGIIGTAFEADGPTGTLVVQGGATLATALLDLGSGFGGDGGLVVRGAGTRVIEGGGDPLCANSRTYNVSVVGSRNSGSMLVADGAELNNTFLTLGREPGASGAVTVSSQPSCDPLAEPRALDCAQLNLLGVAADGADQGFPAFGQVGRGGAGLLALQRGRVVVSLGGDTVTDLAKAGHGFNVGRDAGGVGTVRLADQSKFLIESTGSAGDIAFFVVGRNGTGLLEISGGSLFEAQGANGFFLAAREPGSTGQVHLQDADSTLTVDGLVGLSRDSGGLDGGVSLLTLDVGTTLNAGEIDARANSTIFSAGTINVAGPFNMAGVFNPGFSPGTAVINGDFSLTSTGLLRLEIFGSGGSGDADSLVVNGDFDCDDCTIQVALADGATVDDVSSAELLKVSGDSTGDADIQVVDEDGETVATFEDVDLSSAPFFTALVQIDIKPDSSENTVNLGSGGVLPVAILSSSVFDATEVDPASVQLSSAEIRLRGKGYLASQEDVNSDGLLDLVIQVDIEALDLTATSETAQLSGQTFSGTAIEGSDSIRVVEEDA